MTSSTTDFSRHGVPGPGAHVSPDGVIYRVWAPAQGAMTVRIRRAEGEIHALPLVRGEDGYFGGTDAAGRSGDWYWFVTAEGSVLPDPASRYQPQGVHGWSECVDPRTYAWRSAGWRRPGWHGQSIYELHVGAFTREGTFRAAIGRLDHVASLGVEAIELMPVADFPGGRNWGYDGVALFAPARCYGRPDDLRALVDAAHGHGLAVILDVVYNHLGPDGNYLARYAPAYFAPDRHTPWGQAFNLSGPEAGPVREFFRANAAYWLDEFRIDGLRLDATHAIEDESPRHLLAEIAAVVHARGGFVIAEDERNTAEVVRRADGSGHGIDAVWADDFHHEVRVALTGARESYFRSYTGTPADVGRTLERGWFYAGQPFPPWKGRPRGEAGAHLPVSAFVHCIENHDQVGNRAKGERLEQLVSPPAFRAAVALLCLSPYPPLLFMGQEWAASAPFLYFTDHAGELGRAVSEGRQKEFAATGLNEGFRPEEVPDPQAPGTFLRSKLDWDECEQPTHAAVLALHRDCLWQRTTWLRGTVVERAHWRVAVLERAVAIRYEAPGEPVRLVIAALWGKARIRLALDARLQPPAGSAWRVAIDSRGGGKTTVVNGTALELEEPATLLLVVVEEGVADECR